MIKYLLLSTILLASCTINTKNVYIIKKRQCGFKGPDQYFDCVEENRYNRFIKRGMNE